MMLNAQLIRDGRKAERETLDVGGTLRHLRNTPIDVIVEDLSSTGFRIRTDAILVLQEKVSIGIAGIGQQQAYVVRQTDAGFGCEFVEPIDSRLVDAPLTAQPVIAAKFGDRLDAQLVRDWSVANPPHVERFSQRSRLLIVCGLGAAGWLAVIGVALIL